MSELTELPDWVYELVAGLRRYEEEHPMLYAMEDVNVYRRVPCVNGLTSLVPREVTDATELLVKHGAIEVRSMFVSAVDGSVAE